MRKAYSLLIATALCMCLQAQKTPDKWRYASLTQGGIAAGSSTATYTAQTIQGIQKNGLFTGIGIGVDNYGMPGFPLVAHLQKAFTQKRSKPFIYGQAGVQFAWKKGEWADTVQFARKKQDQYDLNNGFIGELGGGYLFSLGKNKRHAISLSAGYSYKHNSATYKQLSWPIYWDPIPTPANFDTFTTEEHRFHYRRIVVKVGYMF